MPEDWSHLPIEHGEARGPRDNIVHGAIKTAARAKSRTTFSRRFKCGLRDSSDTAHASIYSPLAASIAASVRIPAAVSS